MTSFRPTARPARRSPARQGARAGTRAGWIRGRRHGSHRPPSGGARTAGPREAPSPRRVRRGRTDRRRRGRAVPDPRRLIAHAVGAIARRASQLGLLMLFICDQRSPGRSARPSRMPAAVSSSASCAGATFRSIPRRWEITPATRGRASCKRCSAAPSADDGARSGTRAPCAAPRSTRSRVRRIAMYYVASCSFATVTYKALAAADRLGRVLSRPASTPTSRRRSSCSTSGTPPTPRRPGSAHSRSGCSVTTARSTRSPATSNRMHAREGRLGARDARGGGALPPGDRRCRVRLGHPRRDASRLLTKEGGVRGVGRDIRRAIAMLVPAAWEDAPDMDQDGAGSTAWHASLMEPWDGPAALIFTDGVAGRRGPRPQRAAAPALLGDRRRPRRLRVRGRGRRLCRRAACGAASSGRAR